MPSIQKYGVTGEIKGIEVLNLVISGMPSIPKKSGYKRKIFLF